MTGTLRHPTLSRGTLAVISPPRAKMGWLAGLRHNAMHGISWNAIFRMWETSHKTADDWRREADVRQSAIIIAGLQLGTVVPNGRGGFEVRP